jgi:hypothetical protein
VAAAQLDGETLDNAAPGGRGWQLILADDGGSHRVRIVLGGPRRSIDAFPSDYASLIRPTQTAATRRSG